MPFNGLVWVDRQPHHTLVYADESLLAAGQLSRAGQGKVDEALAAIGAEPLRGAKPCMEHPL